MVDVGEWGPQLGESHIRGDPRKSYWTSEDQNRRNIGGICGPKVAMGSRLSLITLSRNITYKTKLLHIVIP